MLGISSVGPIRIRSAGCSSFLEVLVDANQFNERCRFEALTLLSSEKLLNQPSGVKHVAPDGLKLGSDSRLQLPEPV